MTFLIIFGILKKGNAANQREHLVLLLTNIYTRKNDLSGYGQVHKVPSFFPKNFIYIFFQFNLMSASIFISILSFIED